VTAVFAPASDEDGGHRSVPPGTAHTLLSPNWVGSSLVRAGARVPALTRGFGGLRPRLAVRSDPGPPGLAPLAPVWVSLAVTK
jgi:hypothetical protein